ncbi:MAG: nickel insertion protein [Anaerolineae bacterium]
MDAAEEVLRREWGLRQVRVRDHFPLARPDQADALAGLILRETPTLGVRVRPVARVVADRREAQIETDWGTVRVKEKWLDGRKVAASPEYEDCARIARERGIPLQDVYAAVSRVLG